MATKDADWPSAIALAVPPPGVGFFEDTFASVLKFFYCHVSPIHVHSPRNAHSIIRFCGMNSSIPDRPRPLIAALTNSFSSMHFHCQHTIYQHLTSIVAELNQLIHYPLTQQRDH